MTRLRQVAVAAALMVAVALAPLPGHAQSVDSAADDLRSNDVTFEDGAVTDQDLDELDQVASQLQADGGYFKVVVLASAVDQFSSARAYAERVRSALSGQGRVIVLDPEDVGIASNVPGEASKINDAELAAIAAANRSNSFGTGVLAAADVLGVSGSAGGFGGSGSNSQDPNGSEPSGARGTSGGSILPLVLMIAFVGLVGFGFYRWWSSRKKKQGPPMSKVSQAEGEQKVRTEVETASNLVIDLADRTEQPDAAAGALSAFREGASEFADLQDDLEAADTREELEAVYPRLVHSRWKLECSRALLDAQPVPPEPTPGPLFPLPPPPAPGRPPAPEPHYQQHKQHSPWLTNAAITAITVLAARGLGHAMGGNRRQPSNDDWFRERYGGGYTGGGSSPSGGRGGSNRGQSRPRISMGGRRGRGMGRR